MASIVKRKRRAGYEVRWVDAGRHRSRSFDDLRAAKRFLKIAKAGAGPPHAPELYVACQKWLTKDLNTCRPPTYKHYRHISKRLCDDLGRKVPITSITPDVIAAQRDRLATTLEPKTVNNHLRAIRALCSFCESQGWISSNPVKSVKFPRYRVKVPHWLSEDEADALVSKLKKAAPHIRLALLLALRAGLRLGDLSALQWQDITDDAIMINEGKSKEPRIVPIHPDIRPALAAMPRVGPYVFAGVYDTTTHRMTSRFGITLRSWLKRNGFAVGVHGLRHTFATQLAQAGATLTDLRQLLGHTSISTSEMYLHSSTSRQADLVARLGQPHRELRVLSA
jgi:integrase